MKTNLLFILVLAALFASQAKSQNLTLGWAKSMGGTGHDSGLSSTVDAMGNVYVTGLFMDTVDFDPGMGVSSLIAKGSRDIFVQKLDTSGDLIWVKSIGGFHSDRGNFITVDARGDVYITGYFMGTVDFDPGPGVNNLSANGAIGYSDIFVLKLDASGNFLWVKSFGETGSDWGNSLAIDEAGNVFVTGTFKNTINFDPDSGLSALSSKGGYDIFVLKLDETGNLLWAKSMGGTGEDYGNFIALDETGNLYITGYFNDVVDFDPGSGITDLVSNGVRDIFLQKLNSSGNLLWVKSMGGINQDESWAVVTDLSGNIYLSGHFQGTENFDPDSGLTILSSNGKSDIFVLKLNPQGNLIWAKSFGGAGNDICLSIASDRVGNIYLSGAFQGTLDFDPDSGLIDFNLNENWDIFVLKLDSSGNLSEAISIKEQDYEESHNDITYSLNVDPLGNVYIAGVFGDAVDFDPGSGATNLIGHGSGDIFIAKFNTCDLVSIEETRKVFIPSAFTPNNDSNNDLFMIYAGEGRISEIKSLQIFSRWGEKVFEAKGFQPNDPAYAWDGRFKNRTLNPAVFVYLAEVEFIDGFVKLFKGSITLLP